jgi:hypothetical protein
MTTAWHIIISGGVNYMTLEEVKKMYGTSYRFSVETGMSHANWLHWARKDGFIPISTQIRLEKITNGLLKARLEDIKK